MQPLASNIKYLRKKRGQTQQELSEILGYSNSTTILKWETDKADPPVKTVKAIAEYYGIDMADLVYSDLGTIEIKKTDKARERQIRLVSEYWKLLSDDQQSYVWELIQLFSKQNSDV